jgi:hypothetical protein
LGERRRQSDDGAAGVHEDAERGAADLGNVHQVLDVLDDALLIPFPNRAPSRRWRRSSIFVSLTLSGAECGQESHGRTSLSPLIASSRRS